MLAVSEFLVLYELCTILNKGLLDVDFDAGFIANGGDSLGAVALAATCKSHGLDLPRQKILKSQTLRSILSMKTCMTEAGIIRVKEHLVSKLPYEATELSYSSSTSSFDSAPLTGLDGAAGSQWLLPENPGNSLSPSRRTSVQISDTSFPPRSAGPLTEMQLLFIHGSLRKTGLNVITHSEIYETNNIPILKKAWRQVVESESIFNQDLPHHQALDASTTCFDWSDPATERSIESNDVNPSITSSFRVTSIDDSTEPALSKITWKVHHSLIDGFSASILVDKVLRIANGEAPLPPGPSFSQFVRELDLFRKANWELGNAYWASKQNDLNRASHELLLPLVLSQDDYAGSSNLTFDIRSLSQDIQLRARSIGVTPTSFFNAAWALTLALYTDSDLVSFGAILWGRNLPIQGALNVIGPLLNALPLIIHTTTTFTSKELLQSTFNELVELEDHQWTTSENGFHRNFHTALSIQLELSDRSERYIRPLSRQTHQELETPLGITVDPERQISFNYHFHKFSKFSIQCLGETYLRTLSLLLESNSTVDDISRHLLPTSQVDLLRRFGNCSSSTLTEEIKDDLVTSFERRVREIPYNIAIEKGCQKMTYQELDKIASRIAFCLSSQITRGDIVCVHSDRSIFWLCAIFGILKAGGVYCSMDPTFPKEARNGIFGLSGAKVFIKAMACQSEIVPEFCSVSLTVEDIVNSAVCEELEHRHIAEPQSPAYVCFTSGSTGTPKGVLCTHSGLVAFQSSLDVRLFAAPGRKVAQVMSVAFDGSIHELFSALTYGATLVLPSGSDPFGHLHSVDSAILTPSLARLLDPKEFEQLKWVYFVGEPVPQTVCDRWASVKQLYNMYGPTEGTCGATINRLLPGRPVTIGVPNPTTRVYILTSKKTLSPPGAIGEVYLAGVQIAKGYLNSPHQTQQRFTPDTIWPMGVDEMMYQTGDRGYWTEDGEIALLGRKDREIKWRGYRLDMGDLEIRIARAYPSLQAVAVAHSKDQLIAMVQPKDTDIAKLRERLGKVLPQYAMPQSIVTVDRLPVTSAGKVDYKAVSETNLWQQESRIESKNLTTPAEFSVADAYRAVLQLQDDVELVASSNFIELGGHSLRQLELLQHLSASSGVRLSFRTIIACQTVRELAKAVENGLGSASSSIADQKLPVREGRVTPIELEWMKKYEISSETSAFNVCYSSIFDNNVVNKESIIDAWNLVLKRHHRMLHLYDYSGNGEAIRIDPGSVPRVQTQCSFDLWSEANRPFDLKLEQPIRVFVTENRLTVVLSHIIADYTALAILISEASNALNGNLLDNLPRSYYDANVWYEAPCQKDLDFWSSYLKDFPENPFPFGSEPRRIDYSGTSVTSIIDAEIVGSALQYSVSANVTLQQMALACVATCLDQNHSETDIVLGVPHINRNCAEDLDTFGLFLQPLPVRITYGKGSPEYFMQSVKSSSQTALAHAIQWHELLQHLNVQTKYPNHPLFDIMVTMHDFRNTNKLEMKVAGFDESFVWSEGAKFKLLCEFTALPNGKMLLRIEYDAGIISKNTIEKLHHTIPIAMRMISRGIDHDTVKSSLRNVDVEDHQRSYNLLDANCIFGKVLNDII